MEQKHGKRSASDGELLILLNQHQVQGASCTIFKENYNHEETSKVAKFQAVLIISHQVEPLTSQQGALFKSNRWLSMFGNSSFQDFLCN